jgi:hypothetical protein
MSTRSASDIRPPSHDSNNESSTPSDPAPLGPNADRALAALAAVARGVDENEADLHAAICEYVQELRTEGRPAEQAVILIKRVIVQAGLREDGSPEMTAVIRDVISLCIDEFYRT